jgi:phytoene dehydrogenase-like protein
MKTNLYDAVIVGGGHNGLVCAAYLAKAGRKVLVLERRPMLGGCAVTEEVWPGYRISVASYLVSLLKDEIVRDLDLKRFGYHVYPKDPPFFTPFPDGRHLFMWQNSARTIAEIARFSEHDAKAFPKYDEHLEHLARTIDAMLLGEPPEDVSALDEVLDASAEEFLDRWFESDEIKVTLATDGVIGANGGPRTKGTAYVLLHHCMGMAAGRRALWGYVRGGMGALSEAIAASARESGAEIRTEAAVSHILIKNGVARGVVLASGDEIEASWVISNLDPKATFQRLVDPRELPDEFNAKIAAYRCTGPSMKMNLALSGLPKFTAFPETPGPHHRATIHLCPSIDYVERAWAEASQGRPSRNPMLEIGIPSMYDDTLAPAGHHVMSIFLQYTPYNLKETTWDEMREPYSERVIDVIGQYAPNIRDILVSKQVLSPIDLEQRFGITGGNIFHGELIREQLFSKRPSYATPIQGLYLCGSGTHPGGGVMGASGHNAAKAILQTEGGMRPLPSFSETLLR